MTRYDARLRDGQIIRLGFTTATDVLLHLYTLGIFDGDWVQRHVAEFVEELLTYPKDAGDE